MLPIISRKNVPEDTRRGGKVQTLLSPKTVGSTSGFMGVAHVGPGEKVAEHYHPYSEEFLYLVEGTLEVQVDGEPHTLHAGDGITLPIKTRHRLVNRTDEPAFAVFHLGPLAPRPDLGHVDTEGPQLNDHKPPAPKPQPRREPTGNELNRFQASLMPWELGLWSLGWLGGAPTVWPVLNRGRRGDRGGRLFGRGRNGGRR